MAEQGAVRNDESATKEDESASDAQEAAKPSSEPAAGTSAQADKTQPEPPQDTSESSKGASQANSMRNRAEADACASMAAKKQELTASIEHARRMMSAFRLKRNDSGIDGYPDTCLCSKKNETRARLASLEETQKELLSSIKDINQELVDFDKHAAHALVTRELTAEDIEERNEMLSRILRLKCRQSADNYKEQRALRKELEEEDDLIEQIRHEVEDSIASASDQACDLETACSLARKCNKETRELLDAMKISSPLVDAAKAELTDRLSSALGELVELESELGRWYDRIDEISGVDGAISYGAGVDFSMEKDEFVKKWGSAIDAFYDDYSKIEGPVALQGYGRDMAASAYAHRVDPRLCAAVSIAESSGGKHCIRPCNAWGWGAADNDPYELAFEWESFDESIEAWHEGMATSKTGLATSSTLSSLASIYCSSPQWGATVAEYMKQISQHVG